MNGEECENGGGKKGKVFGNAPFRCIGHSNLTARLTIARLGKKFEGGIKMLLAKERLGLRLAYTYVRLRNRNAKLFNGRNQEIGQGGMGEREKGQKAQEMNETLLTTLDMPRRQVLLSFEKKVSLFKRGPSGLPIAILYDAKDEFERKRICRTKEYTTRRITPTKIALFSKLKF